MDLQRAVAAHVLAQSLLRRIRRNRPDWRIVFPPIENASDPEQIRRVDIAFANDVRTRLGLSTFPADADSQDVIEALAHEDL